jgi:hypothetical protein
VHLFLAKAGLMPAPVRREQTKRHLTRQKSEESAKPAAAAPAPSA